MKKLLIKKTLCLMAMMLALTFSAQAMGSRASEQGGLGDVNGDGEVTVADVAALIDMIVTDEGAAAGDLNGDGEINISDINALIDMIFQQYVDPHDSGYWLLIFNRFEEPVWYEMVVGSNGDYTTSICLEQSDFFDPDEFWAHYAETGERPRTSLFIVIDGVKYGAEQGKEEVILGTTMDNPLIPSYIGYTIVTGYNYNVGVARIEDQYYLYVAQAGWVSN